MWRNDGDLRVLCIEGFSRENGNTKALLEEFLSDYIGSDIIRYNTFKESPLPCLGCGYCNENAKCSFDDLDGFFELFETADILIFASPVYNLSFPAPLKALIDRLQPYYTSFYADGKVQRIKKRRRAYLLVTSGRDGAESFNIMEKQLKNVFSITNIEYMGGKLQSYTDYIKGETNGTDYCAQGSK